MLGWPSEGSSIEVTRRAVMSLPPPGASGRIQRIGRLGHGACARHDHGAARGAATVAVVAYLYAGNMGDGAVVGWIMHGWASGRENTTIAHPAGRYPLPVTGIW